MHLPVAIKQTIRLQIIPPVLLPWSWNFGDGQTSNAPNPTHNYVTAVPTNYNVSLIVTSSSGCSDTIIKQISVNQSTTINTPANPVCNNTLVTIFTTAPANIIGYVFDFGDGSPGQGSGSGATSHTYTKPGVYFITVQTTDNNGCVETSAPYKMTVSGPTVKFTTPTQVSCGPLAAIFTDQSTAAPGSTLKTWFWDFGDGKTAIGQIPPVHNYSNQGIYQVMLKVTDNNGCSDSLIQPNYITVSIPVANYTTASTNYCPSSFIKFNNTSTGGFNPVYTWDFKDGTTYTGTNPPPHNYPLVGKYLVSLSIKDAYNCASTSPVITPINIDTPNATFTMSSNYSACPPLVVNFKFAGHYDSLYSWNFDNTGISIIKDPNSIYSQPGDYYPKLIVTSPGGCIATYSDHIHIDGPIGALSYSPLVACDSLDVNFLVTTSNSVSFTWNFNDGNTLNSVGPTTTHHYNIPGAYFPFVTLVDAAGCKVNVYGTNQIEIDSIEKTQFIADKNQVCDNGIINFTNTVIVPAGTTISNYTWDFGDGSPLQSGMFPTISHNYTVVGNYNPTMTITTLGGCTGTASLPVSVVASPQVTINGLISQCEPAILNFLGAELVPDPNGPLTWSWNFGNGQTANVQNPGPGELSKSR